jgi:hypothetical protein
MIGYMAIINLYKNIALPKNIKHFSAEFRFFHLLFWILAGGQLIEII